MKGKLWAILLLLVAVTLAGCGGGGNDHPAIVQDILSNDNVDGYVVEDTAGNRSVGLVVRDGLNTVPAGIDPVTDSEYRAFLDFPLTSIPVRASVIDATLDLTIRDYNSTALSIPLRIDLVSFGTTLTTGDFDRALLIPLDTRTVNIFPSDLNHHVVIDVTDLMLTAQRLSLADFQIRVMEDLGTVVPGRIAIDDSTNTTVAPLLTVNYVN
ncbi:hypothetical protein L4X63_02420 [Geomonas sp. Red32]|uniref:hypothetical protein n=1 Tax=Geomonas sp. Red32 TaxID=2912856 RepID=UPI00202CD5B1|nr:hypothetical protein [Geomonas sp. Red32]MCM0080435.1 hypothetical protein [Geomonas sp. Red32]